MTEKLLPSGVVAIIIIFQPELRRALEQLGRKRLVTGLINFGEKGKKERFSTETVNAIVSACYEMGAVYTGALIVIEQDMILDEYERTGIEVDGIVTSQLLINIFEHKSNEKYK